MAVCIGVVGIVVLVIVLYFSLRVAPAAADKPSQEPASTQLLANKPFWNPRKEIPFHVASQLVGNEIPIDYTQILATRPKSIKSLVPNSAIRKKTHYIL